MAFVDLIPTAIAALETNFKTFTAPSGIGEVVAVIEEFDEKEVENRPHMVEFRCSGPDILTSGNRKMIFKVNVLVQATTTSPDKRAIWKLIGACVDVLNKSISLTGGCLQPTNIHCAFLGQLSGTTVYEAEIQLNYAMDLE
jgi:hypothetical protein